MAEGSRPCLVGLITCFLAFDSAEAESIWGSIPPYKGSPGFFNLFSETKGLRGLLLRLFVRQKVPGAFCYLIFGYKRSPGPCSIQKAPGAFCAKNMTLQKAPGAFCIEQKALRAFCI